MVVMEPTLVSFHDASRLIEVIELFNIPFGIILKKADLNKKGRELIKDYIASKGFLQNQLEILENSSCNHL